MREGIHCQPPFSILKPPLIGIRTLLRQFWRDIYGKEVQTAATYSYLWMADQMAHIGIGIVLDFAVTALIYQGLYRVKGPWNDEWSQWPYELAGFLITSALVSFWEYRAYKKDTAAATGLFALDRKLLRSNAIAAAFYMILGAALGWAFHRSPAESVPAAFIAAIIAIVVAPGWLRQKIIWQKAGLPFLFRLADLEATILQPAVKALQELVVAPAPPAGRPRQIVVAGPPGSGRTELASGLGTEFAFKRNAVRYLSIGNLIEFALHYEAGSRLGPFEDRGPKNIEYWRWSEAQILIIDDIGPLIATDTGAANHARFEELLHGFLKGIAPALATRHTVWILGHLGDGEGDQALAKYAAIIRSFCRGGEDPIAILLSPKGVAAVQGPAASAIPA